MLLYGPAVSATLSGWLAYNKRRIGRTMCGAAHAPAALAFWRISSGPDTPWAHVPSTAHINHCILRKRSSDPEVLLATQRHPHSPDGYTSVRIIAGEQRIFFSPIFRGSGAGIKAFGTKMSPRIIRLASAQ